MEENLKEFQVQHTRESYHVTYSRNQFQKPVKSLHHRHLPQRGQDDNRDNDPRTRGRPLPLRLTQSDKGRHCESDGQVGNGEGRRAIRA